MAANSNTRTKCPKCDERQRLYLAALQDKRTILLRLQKEIEHARQLREELDAKKRQDKRAIGQKDLGEGMEMTASTSKGLKGPELQSRLTEAMSINKKWKDEYEELKQKYKTETQLHQEELNSVIQKVEECNTHIYALESENMRLAQLLSGQDVQTCRPSQENNENELMKFQMQTYKEDFSHERRDREKAQNEKESLQEQLNSAHEIIATLTQEIDVYKTQHDHDQDEIRRLVSRQAIPQPELHLVYPVVDQNKRQQETSWRRQQQRRGIYTRGPTLPPPSVFYGGDVEVDQPDGSEPVITDGYSTI